MRHDKGWLQNQMRDAKREVNDWQGWKKDTIRKEISDRLGSTSRSGTFVTRSSTTGRFVILERKK
jgi:hypothetical protein